MKKIWWKLYYNFVTPKGKSEIVKSYCRTNGMKYKDMSMSAFSVNDFDGKVSWTKED